MQLLELARNLSCELRQLADIGRDPRRRRALGKRVLEIGSLVRQLLRVDADEVLRRMRPSSPRWQGGLPHLRARPRSRRHASGRAGRPSRRCSLRAQAAAERERFPIPGRIDVSVPHESHRFPVQGVMNLVLGKVRRHPATLSRRQSARSSGDRALPCGGRGRKFESCRAHSRAKAGPLRGP